MDTSKRQALELRRKEFLLRMEATEYIEQRISPSLDIFAYLQQQQVDHRIAGFVHIPSEYKPYFKQAIAQPPYSDYNFEISHLETASLQALVEHLANRFPSVNPLRYVPDLTKYADYYSPPPGEVVRDGLQKARRALDLVEQEVYVFYLHPGLVLKFSLDILCMHDHEELFSTWIGEVMIFSDEGDWLITFTLEEEWIGGRLNRQ